MAFAGRVLRDSQNLGNFIIAQLLEMAERQHFPIERVHLLQRGSKPGLKFVPDGGLAG